MIRHCLYILLVITLLFACKKKDDIVVIPGNQPPPDYTIPTIVKENYINKVYISVLGRKPEAAEYDAGLNYINEHNLSLADRTAFLDEVLAKPEYNRKLYEVASVKLINSFDTSAITDQIGIFQFLLTDSAYAAVFDILNMEIARLQQLKAVPADLNTGTINIIGMHRRLINNYFYDQINMGTENFVVSTFQHFMERYPTFAELEQGKNMVDGFNAIVFWQQGNTKDDYMDIILATSNYFESQVRELFLLYLFREPTSQEMSKYAAEYKQSLDYKKLQKTLLSLDEYVGI